jgi:hypothetical protein
MKMKKLILAIWIALFLTIFSGLPIRADDTDLLTLRIDPDVLIILDWSGSMRWNAAGTTKFGVLPPNRRIDIAVNVLKELLDDNDSGAVDNNDGQNLKWRLGYMRFNGVGSDDPTPAERYYKNDIKIFKNETDIGTTFKKVWDKIYAEYTSEADPVGGCTPLANTLEEVKDYFLEKVMPNDTAWCRKRFVIFITDGADNTSCYNCCDPPDPDQHPEDECNKFPTETLRKKRMLTVKRAKELKEIELNDGQGHIKHGPKVFFVGFGGSLIEVEKRLLEWGSKYGGTDNPLEPNTGNPDAYNIDLYPECFADFATNALPDPANYPLGGYAFLAQDGNQLDAALRMISQSILEGSFSYTAPTVPSVQTYDNKVLYIASFTPVEGLPLWEGHLKAYKLKDDGTLPVQNGYLIEANRLWDAGVNLNNKTEAYLLDPNQRKIYTNIGGTLKDFIPANLTDNLLGLGADSINCNEECVKLIKHIRGIDTYDFDEDTNKKEKRGWILGDILHSNPIVVGPPSRFFQDEGFSGPGNFYERNKEREKVILAGANDGMLHAFLAGTFDQGLFGGKGGYNTGTGEEVWSFIPKSVLTKLQEAKWKGLGHTYYVDSSPKVANVWLGDTNGSHHKDWEEWKTVLISGLRKGGNSYFALDITETTNPKLLWEFTDPNMGQSWSEPAIGRVKIGNQEISVAFIGGGYDDTSAKGRALFVINIATGEVIWRFTNYGNDGFGDSFNEKQFMTYPLAASPAAVDINLDGFVDKVYVGDLGGQMWVFDVSRSDLADWKGRRLFTAPKEVNEKHLIYYPPVVSFDDKRDLWVYFGTGDRENIQDMTGERFYAVKDDGLGSYPRTQSNLKDVTSDNTFTPLDNTLKGWFIKLANGEKVLAKPAIFNRVVYFTTYLYSNTGDPCATGGTGRLYAVEYLSGGGALDISDLRELEGNAHNRSTEIGPGIPSAPVISVNPQGTGFVTVQTSGGDPRSSPTINFPPRKTLYWREATQ